VTIPRFGLLSALLIGMIAGGLAYRASLTRAASTEEFKRSDFAVVWQGARFLIDGRDPYPLIGYRREWHYQGALVYPPPALLVASPLAAVPLPIADALFVGLSFAACAYALLRRGAFRLWTLLSGPAVLVCQVAQWSVLLTAAALLPWAGGLLLAKPTVGAALAAYCLPDRRWFWRAAFGGTLLLAATFVLLPRWPASYLAALGAPLAPAMHSGVAASVYQAPIGQFGGPLLLLALLRWRRPEARLLLALAVVPHAMVGYELLPVLALVPATALETLLLTAGSWVMQAFLVNRTYADGLSAWLYGGKVSIWTVYLPALLLILRRPNEGAMPTWLHRMASRGALRRSRLRHR
jgi:hypothetical protein